MTDPATSSALSRSQEEAAWLHHGRTRELAQDLDGALSAYLTGGAWSEAARILSHLGRFEDAGHAMLLHLPARPADVSVLSAEQRRGALNAALCFARCGARHEAVGLLLNLGENSKAASLLNMAGMRREAVAAMRGEANVPGPWPDGILFRLRQPKDLLLRSKIDGVTDEMPLPQTSGETPLPAFESAIQGPPRSAPTPPPDAFGALRTAWLATPVPAKLLNELERRVARGREPGATAATQAAFYAAGRLFEYSTRPDLAGRAYRVVPGILDASFRLSQTDQGKVECTDGQWLPPRVFGAGRLGTAELPDLDGLQAEAIRSKNQQIPPPDPGESVDPMGETIGGGVKPLPPPQQQYSLVNQPVQTFEGVTPETMIDGRYRVVEEIGAGGMARVFRALDTELGEEVALKLFLQLAREGAGLDRFRREMKLSRKLLHPSIVRVLEYGIWNGARYLTMELLEGHDLEGFQDEKPDRILDLGEGLQLLMQACDGLSAAHATGVIHRDIKPQNLFVVDNGKRLKVMDFGIAKVIGSSSLSITGVRVGTPRYMSPEQIEGGDNIGPPADLYALGGVMYEMCTGTPPFLDQELMPLLLNQMAEMPDLPRTRNADVPKSVEDVIMKLLAKDPADRYSDAKEVRGELLRLWVELQRRPD